MKKMLKKINITTEERIGIIVLVVVIAILTFAVVFHNSNDSIMDRYSKVSDPITNQEVKELFIYSYPTSGSEEVIDVSLSKNNSHEVYFLIKNEQGSLAFNSLKISTDLEKFEGAESIYYETESGILFPAVG